MFAYYLELGWLSLRRHRVLTALMVLAIAVGIGASMTTFTVMYLLSGDPLPGISQRIYYPQMDIETGKGMVRKHPADQLDSRTATDLWRSGKADRQTLTAQAMVKLMPQKQGQRAEMDAALATTSDFFAMFGVPFRYGGPWTAADDDARSRVVVIDGDLNRQRFGGANSVGQTLHLNGTDLRIVGVLDDWRPPLRFYTVAGGHGYANSGEYYEPPNRIMAPLTTLVDMHSRFDWFNCWGDVDVNNMQAAKCEWIGVWVQLDSLAHRLAYRRYLDGYDAEQHATGRFDHPSNVVMPSLMEWLDYNEVVPRDVHLQVWLAFGFLLVCICNTVGLLLVKFLGRSAEIGVRRAMGAARRDIFLQYLIEAGTVGVVGGLGGLLLSWFGVWLVRQQAVPYADLARLDPWLLLATICLAVLASLLAGCFPALRASQIQPALQIKVS